MCKSCLRKKTTTGPEPKGTAYAGKIKTGDIMEEHDSTAFCNLSEEQKTAIRILIAERASACSTNDV